MSDEPYRIKTQRKVLSRGELVVAEDGTWVLHLPQDYASVTPELLEEVYRALAELQYGEPRDES